MFFTTERSAHNVVKMHMNTFILMLFTTAGGYQLKGAGQGLVRGHSIDAQGLTSSRLSKAALPGGESVAGTPEGR